MAATLENVLENKTLGKKELNELAEYLSRDWNTWVGEPKARLDKEEFKEILRWLNSLGKKERISDADFKGLVVLCLALFVENEIEKRFEKVFVHKFSSILDAGTR